MAHAQAVASTPAAGAPAHRLYAQHCAACHGAERLGGMGPALMPESLERLKRKDAIEVITHGRAATQMPAFGDTLSSADIDAVTAWIYSPQEPRPHWAETDIRASRTETSGWAKWPAKPAWKADPLNLFVVVEGGDHHVSLLDGDRFKVIHRFASRFALHGGPKFSPDGRYVYFGSRDGWITKYDLYNLKVVAEVRAGINMRNVAVSGDGRYVMAANYLPHSVVLFDSSLNLLKLYPVRTLDGKQSSRVSAVYDASPRQSFVVALKDLPELWEISYDPKAEPIYNGYVHDYRMGESLPEPGTFGVRRTPLSAPLDDFFFDQDYRYAIGSARPRTGETQADSQVISLDARRAIAHIDLPGMPHLGSGITWSWQRPDGSQTTVLASPNLKDGVISVIDMQTWKTVTQIPTLGPGFFMRSHESSRYAWVDAMMHPASKNKLMLIDKVTLKPAHTLEGEPGKTLTHIEFTRDGKYALASLWEMDGALIVYDARTLKEVKRLPMSKPVGKYNVYNKITKSEGTSH
ncbi:cytochrome D1 domain-containing protein [Aquabacterium sp.]|uniref:cytochrome D1 domain-containing protein n=1 Tax=Aquabacterium sp. TaxID=1872578 RepID=UPI0025C7376D|nr:cytochrome D1 domain-containing protein [Aquabacterium sp.]